MDREVGAAARDASLARVERVAWELYSPRQRRAFLGVLFLVLTCSYIDKNIVTVLLERIKGEFHVSDAMLGILSGMSFAVFYASFGIPLARWADRGNRKSVITLALVVWSCMTMLCGYAGSFSQLAIARFGVGAGEAGAMPPAQSLVAEYYPPAQRPGAIGLLMMSSAAGYAAGLIYGGIAAHYFGWRVAFYSVGLLGLALVPLVRRVLGEPRQLMGGAAVSKVPENAVAAVRALLAKRSYGNILAATTIYFFMGYGALIFIVSLIMRVDRLNIAQAGVVFGTVSALGAAGGNVLGGALANRFAARDAVWMPRLAGYAMIAAVPLYEMALSARSIYVMAPLLLVSYVVLTSVMPPMFSAMHHVCGTPRRAMAVALLFFVGNLVGMGLGPVTAGALSDHLAIVHGQGEGLRSALMWMMWVLVPGGLLMLRAARYQHAEAEA